MVAALLPHLMRLSSLKLAALLSQGGAPPFPEETQHA